MKYIPTEKLIAEINALKERYGSCVAKNEVEKCYKSGRLIGYTDVLYKINKLQQEQPEIDMKSPFTGGKVIILSREKEVTFRGEKIKITRKYYRCVDTGQEFTNSELDDDMMWAIFRAYCEKKGMSSFTDIMLKQEQPDLPSGEEVMTMCNQILIDWVKEGKTQEEKEQREQAHIRFFELYDEYIMQEQPQQDITEFEKALHDFGEAYSMLVDRDNNPNQGIHINAYHELVQEKINEILSLAKEYVKQEKSEVDLEKEMREYFEGWRINYYSETEELLKNNGCTVDIDDVKEIARHFYEFGLKARKEESK